MDNQKIGTTENYYTSGLYWQKHKDASSQFKVNLVLEIFSKFGLEILPGDQLTEVGCGQGAFLLPLASYLAEQKITTRINGYDIAPDAIQLAEKNNIFPNVTFSVGSTNQINDKANYLFCMDVVEHVENPLDFLRTLAQKADLIILHLPVEQSIGHMLLHKPTQSYREFQHIHFYSWETANLLLKEASFEVVGYQFSAASKVIFKVSGNPITKLLRVVRFFLYKINSPIAAILGGGTVLFILKQRDFNKQD
jgi:cyclopropane fatty-acyl-phospholipid synthase-like methyltransferase